MLKRLSLALAGFFALVVAANAAGTIPGFSLTPQFDTLGRIAPGCKLYVIQAGTTSTPQNSYQDSGLTILNPNPLTCDSTGRIGQFFVADGTIKLRLTDKNGNPIFVGDNLLVVGASSGGGGGSPVDPTTVLQTGQLAIWYGVGLQSGFVRANGRTIGSAASPGTERANADTQALFTFLWTSDPNLAVSGGRGASAAADYAANKTIALPDYRGRAIAGLDDMGNAAAGRLTASYFGTAATVLGAAGGAESKVLVTGNLPPYTPAGAIINGAISINHDAAAANSSTTGGGAFSIGGSNASISASQAASTFTGTAQGGASTPVSITQPTILATIYLKL